MAQLERFDALSPSSQTRVLLFLTFAILFISAPLNFVHGFLMTEEGSTYLRYARSVCGWRALVAPHQSYYSLIPNVAMLLPARYVPLMTAPWIAVWTSCAVRLLVAYVVSTCEAFETARMRLLAVVLVALSVGSASMGGTIHSQFFLGVAAAVVLISDPTRHILLRLVILLVAGLEGTVTGALAPFFLYRAWCQKSRLAWIQALIVSALAVVQLYVVHISLPYSTRVHMSLQPTWVYIDSIFNHVVLLSFATRFAYHVTAGYLASTGAPAGITIAFAATLVFACLVWLAHRAGKDATLLLLAGLFSSLCAAVGMEGGHSIAGGGERYFLVGNACVALSLVLVWGRMGSRPDSTRGWLAMLLALVCISGVIGILRYWRPTQYPLRWREQIASWKVDKKTEFHSGPESWYVTGYSLPPDPESLDLPFYIFDSSTRVAFRQ